MNIESKIVWIPVTEDLPKSKGLYLVSTKDRVFVTRYTRAGWDKTYKNEIIAWAEKPEPVKL